MTSTQEAIIKKYKELHEAEQMVEAGEVLKDLQSLQQTTEQVGEKVGVDVGEILSWFWSYKNEKNADIIKQALIDYLKKPTKHENVGVDIEKTINYIMEDYQCSDGEADLEFILRKHLTPTASGEEKASEKVVDKCNGVHNFRGENHICVRCGISSEERLA